MPIDALSVLCAADAQSVGDSSVLVTLTSGAVTFGTARRGLVGAPGTHTHTFIYQ